MEEFKLNITGETQQLVIRKGEALPAREPLKLNIRGTMDAVSRFMKNRFSTLDRQQCYITVCRDEKCISLTTEERSFFYGKIVGALEIDKKFLKWKINTGHQYTAKELSEFIKMNRAAFTDRGMAMRLSSELSNLKVKTDREYENMNDNRANTRVVVGQKVIDMNIPNDFTLCLPLFKGCEPVTFVVEIYVDPSDFSVQLVSPEAEEYIDCEANRLIDEELKRIEEIDPEREIVIIEA